MPVHSHNRSVNTILLQPLGEHMYIIHCQGAGGRWDVTFTCLTYRMAKEYYLWLCAIRYPCYIEHPA